jgi:hypothetical protein
MNHEIRAKDCHVFGPTYGVLPMVFFSVIPQWESGESIYKDSIPSGKRLHNYGKSPFFMGKSTINGHVHLLC